MIPSKWTRCPPGFTSQSSQNWPVKPTHHLLPFILYLFTSCFQIILVQNTRQDYKGSTKQTTIHANNHDKKSRLATSGIESPWKLMFTIARHKVLYMYIDRWRQVNPQMDCLKNTLIMTIHFTPADSATSPNSANWVASFCLRPYPETTTAWWIIKWVPTHIYCAGSLI